MVETRKMKSAYASENTRLLVLHGYEFSICPLRLRSVSMNVILFGVVMIGSVLSLKHFAPRVSKSVMAKKALSTGVQRMNVEQFAGILKGEKRSAYQIIDVRETLELHHARIPGDDIIHLPLSNSNSWSQQILTGALLDSEKPTLCLCHHGVRSMQVASFLSHKAEFEDVWNIEGGIDAYAEQVDPSVGFY